MATINRAYAGINQAAVSFASKLDASDKFFSDMEQAVDAVTYTKVMAIYIAADINSIFSEEELASMPIVNTNKTDDEGYTGNNPDYTKILDGKKTSRVSFFDTMLDRSKWGVALTAELEKISDAINKKEGHDRSLSSKGLPHMKAEMERVKDRRTIVRNLFRKAMRVVQQRAKLSELIGDEVIKFDYWTDKAGAIIESPKPIVLTVPSKSGLFDNFSVSQFLSLNIDEALENREDETPVATWEALLATLKKGADEEEVEDEDNIEITNSKQFETGSSSMLHYIQSDKNVQRLYAQIDKAKSLDDVADFLLTLKALAVEFGDIADHFASKIEKASEIVNKREAA